MSYLIKNESFNYENTGFDNIDAAVLNRKFAKTCVEKKRRDRINRCLDELKDLMSQADDKAKYQKMEKAEILEMAVTFMRNLTTSNTQQRTETTNNANNMQNYALAYAQCLNEFQTCLQTAPGIQEEFKSRIMSQMTRRYNDLVTSRQGAPDNVTIGSQKRKMSQYKKSARYGPYSHTPEKKARLSMDYQSFSSSSYNLSGSCSSLDSFQNNLHNDNESLSCSGTSSPSLSQCSSPLSCSNKTDTNSLNMSSEENVWRPW